MIFTGSKFGVEQIRKIRNVIFTVLEKRLVKSLDKNPQQEIFVVIYYRNMLKVLQRYSFTGSTKQQGNSLNFKVTDVAQTSVKIM